MDEAKCMIKK